MVTLTTRKESVISLLLHVRHLTKYFGGLVALSDAELEVHRGQIKAVIGPNGAGKTTMFDLITGLETPTAGDTIFRGQHITGLKPYEIAAKGISRTFQNVQLFHTMSVVENVMVGRHLRTRSGFLRSALRLSGVRAEEQRTYESAMEELAFVGLEGHAHEMASALPFGQQRMLEMARALATEPQLLLLDEPAAGLNTRETAELAGLILSIREKGITLLLVEHDMELVMDISEEVAVLDQGRKIFEGTPSEVQHDERVIRAYLGEEV